MGVDGAYTCRMKLAGHYHHYWELPARMVLWKPTHGHRLMGSLTPTYVKVLWQDARVEAGAGQMYGG